MEDLDAATLDDVHAFFRRHYLPNNAVLSIVGDVEPDDAFARVERYFGHLAPGPSPAKPDAAPLPRCRRSDARKLRGRARRRGLPHLAAAGPRHPATSTRSTSPSAFSAMARPPACTAAGPRHRASPRAPGLPPSGLIGGNSFGYATPGLATA